jgi:DNA-directed RNA polymerase subunit RPC12/RpoP
MPAPEVFISYCQADKAVALAICYALESAGLACWIAPRNIAPGSDWTTAIVTAVAECRSLVLVFSARTNESDHVPREVLHALEKRRHIFPFRIENVSPTGAIAYPLLGVQWLDAFEPPMEAHIASLVAQIRLLAPAAESVLPQHNPMEQPSSDEQGSPDDIYFLCGQCDQRLVIAAAAAGMTINCPHCGSAVAVPSSETELAGPARDIFELPVSAAAMGTLERCLVAVMGPIGGPLAKNAVSQATTSEELQEMLLACIPSANDQKAFLKACRNASESAAGQNMAPGFASQPEKPASGWDEATIELVTRNLAVYIGPIASIMVRRALAKAKTGADLYERLAAGIQDEKDRQKFLQSAPAGLR